MKYLLIVLLMIVHSIVYSGTIDPKNNDQEYLNYGKKFVYVLPIEGRNEKNDLLLGSCVLIDHKWILTAAHISIEMKTCGVRYQESLISIDKLIIHKDFNIDKFGIADISLGHLSKNIDLDYYPSLYTDQDEINKLCSIVGFGFTGTFQTGSISSDNKRRAGSNIIDKIQDDLLICTPSINRKNSTTLEFLISHGDSGGGLFIESKLAGINSCVMATDGKPNSSYNDESGHTRISKYQPWIKEIIHNYAE